MPRKNYMEQNRGSTQKSEQQSAQDYGPQANVGCHTSLETAAQAYRTIALTTLSAKVNLIEDVQIGFVYDWLCVSAEDVARSHSLLRVNKVRRIINLASMCENKFPDEFKYLRIVINDVPTARLSDHFASTFHFIEDARLAGERCLVHCNAGISRSCSIAIAYVMRFEHVGFIEALEKVSRVRPVCSPNLGFREQLRQLEVQLRGSYQQSSSKKRSGNARQSLSSADSKNS